MLQLSKCIWRRYSVSIRVFVLLSLSTLCTACVLDFVNATQQTREELKRQLSVLDPQGQETLRQSWYGRLLNVLYLTTQNNVTLRDQLNDRQVAELQRLLQEVVDSLSKSGSERNLNASLLAALNLAKAGNKISVVVLPDDAHEILVTPECNRSSITFSAEAVRQIVQTALDQGEVNELQSLVEQFYFGMFQIDPSREQTELLRTPVSILFGPPQSKYVTQKLELQIGAQGTVVWKALAFIIGHEAHHIWSLKCVRADGDISQQRIEAQADVLGTILAITTYNQRCGRKLIASRQDALIMLGEEAPPTTFPPEVAYQMDIVPSPRLLVGASGIATMQSALGPFFDADPSHPAQTVRAAIDERGTELLASKLFAQPIDQSWAASLVSKLVDIPKDEIVATFYRDLTFKSNYHLVDNYLVCTNIEFESKPDNRPGTF